MVYKFFDTSSLMLCQENDFLIKDYKIILSSITLCELEGLKENNFLARNAIKLLEQFSNSYEVIVYKENMLDPFIKKCLPLNNDIRILATAFWYDKNIHPDETVFVTNDLSLKHIANLFFGEDSIEIFVPQEEKYTGYKELYLNDQQLCDLYSDLSVNYFNLSTNQYLIIKNAEGKTSDRLCWNGKIHRRLHYNAFDSMRLGEIKPMQGDDYQMILADSLTHNTLTMVKGKAGSGKTIMSLGFLFSKLEKGEIDKIIIFCNTIATKDAARLGFYPGDKNDKLLDSQIGNLLSSKLGGMFSVEQLIQKEQLVLLPMSDIRGYDTSGMRAGIYISEAQNMSISLMKLALQRIGEDSICIIDGDDNAQVDDLAFANENNGMKRVSKIFRGQMFYGEVMLQNIHRSKIAQVAEAM